MRLTRSFAGPEPLMPWVSCWYSTDGTIAFWRQGGPNSRRRWMISAQEGSVVEKLLVSTGLESVKFPTRRAATQAAEALLEGVQA